jgi:hypothetical protein
MFDREQAQFRWLSSEYFGMGDALADAQGEEDHDRYARALMISVNGDGRITPEERDWILGYLRSAGDSDSILEAISAYDGSEAIEDVVRPEDRTLWGRVLVYDALRACWSDGDLADGERDVILQMADRLEIPRAAVAEIEDLIREEHEQRARRRDLLFPPAMAT